MSNTNTAAVTATITGVLVPSTGKVNTRNGKFNFAVIVVLASGVAKVIDMYATETAAKRDATDIANGVGRAARNAKAVAYYKGAKGAKAVKVGGQFTATGVDVNEARANAIAKAEVALRSAKPAAKRAAKPAAKPAAAVVAATA